MLLEEITCPDDLRSLTPQQLDVLATEIRAFIVASVAQRGGHLGSNLGVVELTLALHRVFHSPEDRILWDTGHLAYVHKLVTGRQAGFAELRQAGGLSGYLCRDESDHDVIENSHASTVLSWAHGLSMAEDLRVGAAHRAGEAASRHHVVAVIGDGALTGGMAYEALNNLGHTGRRAIIILNDNGRSYAPTVGRLTASVSRLRLDPRYLKQRRRAEEKVRQVPMVGQHLAWGLAGARAGLREMLEPPIFFETLGVRYSGPFDGHDLPCSRRRCATPPSSTGRSSSTCSPRRARATRPPSRTRRSTSTTRRCSTRRSAPSPRAPAHRATPRPSPRPS